MTTSLESARGERRAARGDLRIALAITLGFLAAEVAGGLLSRSLALLADAGHMLHDVAALGLALFAMRVADRPATHEKTYGWHRVEILAALANALLLIIVTAAIAWEAFRRLADPPEVRGGLMLAVAVVGLLANLAVAAVLWRRRGENPNMRAAFLHVLADALGSGAAMAAALVIMLTGWTIADPLAGLAIALLIAISAFRLLGSMVNVLLEATPPHIDLPEVRRAMLEIPGVGSVHDLHIWTLTTKFVALSAHAVIEGREPQEVLVDLRRALRTRFGIEHVTVQLERPDWPDEDVHCEGDPRCLA